VPGVEKVGSKTAMKWLVQYGTLDNVMQHAAEIGGVVGEKLRRTRDWLPQARQLLTIKCDMELPVAVTDLALKPQDTAKLAERFDRFGFKSWLRALEGALKRPRLEQREQSRSDRALPREITEPHDYGNVSEPSGS
jgi:DNA polymerase-1